MLILFILRETERERMCMIEVGEGQRERENAKQAPCLAQGPTQGSVPQMERSRPGLKSRIGHSTE